MQISYRTYNSYHCLSLPEHNQTGKKIHDAICEVSKGDCIIMGVLNHGNIQ